MERFKIGKYDIATNEVTKLTENVSDNMLIKSVIFCISSSGEIINKAMSGRTVTPTTLPATLEKVVIRITKKTTISTSRTPTLTKKRVKSRPVVKKKRTLPITKKKAKPIAKKIMKPVAKELVNQVLTPVNKKRKRQKK